MTETGTFVELADGLRGYLCSPKDPGSHPAVLVFQEAFGVNEYIQSECRRLARSGFVALAPDFFRGETFAYGDWDKIRPKMEAMGGDAGALRDIQAAIAFLDRGPNAHKRYGCVGFCLGGRLAFLSSAELAGKVAVAISFYGGGIAPDEPTVGRPILLDRIPKIRASLLLHYGGDDQSITPAEHGRLAQALSEAKVDFGMHVHSKAGHGFASVGRDSYVRDTAEIAWAESIELFERVLVED